MAISSIIVDDVIPSQVGLKELLSEFCPEVSVKGAAADIDTAVGLINTHAPQIVFLDIKLSPGSGFDLFTHFPAPDFEVIFVTAYNEYSLKAFEVEALDYLLKPIHYKSLIRAVRRAHKRLTEKRQADRYERVWKNADRNKFPIPTKKGFEFIPYNEIIYCEGAGEYTMIHLLGKRTIVSTQRLKEIQENLEGFGFLRVHRSWIINLTHVRAYLKEGGGKVEMEEGITLGVKPGKDELLRLLGARRNGKIA